MYLLALAWQACNPILARDDWYTACEINIDKSLVKIVHDSDIGALLIGTDQLAITTVSSPELKGFSLIIGATYALDMDLWDFTVDCYHISVKNLLRSKYSLEQIHWWNMAVFNGLYHSRLIPWHWGNHVTYDCPSTSELTPTEQVW